MNKFYSKILFAVLICFTAIGVQGQVEIPHSKTKKVPHRQIGDRMASSGCPSINIINPDTTFYLLFDTVSNFLNNACTVSQYAFCGENIIRFTALCTNNYLLQIKSPWGAGFYPVSYKISTLNSCDSTGYTCVPLFSSVYDNQIPQYTSTYYLSVTAGVTYDILIDYNCNNPSADPPQLLNISLFKPHVSNVQFYDINPDSLNLSWDGTYDDMVIEYGLKGFIPGSDTIPGNNGVIVHNPSSPYMFTGLVPDSVYDFYFRDKCGVYSANSVVYRMRIPNSSNLPTLNCNTYFSFLHNANPDHEASWILNSCGATTHSAREKIFTFTPDTTGIYSFEHFNGQLSNLEDAIYYKETALGCNESNWTCIGSGSNSGAWTVSFGPLIAGTPYYIMFKTNQLSGAYLFLGFQFHCPSPICSTSPTSITSNANNNTICSGQSVTLSEVGGVLSLGGNFYWFKDSCNGSSIGTGYTKIVSPLTTTTYFVQSQDSCGMGACTSLTINVNPSPTINVTPSGQIAICSGDSVLLNATIGQGFSYQWYRNNIPISGATGNNYIAMLQGNYSVNVIDSIGCSALSSNTLINIVCQPAPLPLELRYYNSSNESTAEQLTLNHKDDFSGLLHISVSPNPFKNEIRISTHNALKGEITVSDALGKIVFTYSGRMDNFHINTSQWSNGVYDLKIITGDNLLRKKIVKN